MYHLYKQNRNYGCRLKSFTVNGAQHLSLENELLKITVLVGKGADIVEFLYKPEDIDCMWHSFTPIQNPQTYAATRASAQGNFLALYEGGWQELFPNYGGACEYKGAEYALHGEVCTVPWSYEVEKDEPEEITVLFWVHTGPYLLQRRMRLKQNEMDLLIEEKVTNESPEQMEFMWGHHPVLGYPFLDDSCEIQIDNENCKIETLANGGVLPPYQSAPWPKMKDSDGNEQYLSKVQPPEAKQYREYGISGLIAGRCCVWSHRLQFGFELEWDVERFPYLWIWEPNGGNPNHPWYGRNYALGIEPWSHLAQSLTEVIQKQTPLKLNPWETMETQLIARIKR